MPPQAASDGRPAIANEKEETGSNPMSRAVTVTVNVVVTTKMMTVAQTEWKTGEEDEDRRVGNKASVWINDIQSGKVTGFVFVFRLDSVICRIILLKKPKLKLALCLIIIIIIIRHQ